MGPQTGPGPRPSIGYGPLPDGYQQNFGQPAPNRKKLGLFFVIGAVLLVLLTTIWLLGSRKDPAQDSLVNLVVAQNELIRISDNVEKDLSVPSTRRYDAELNATLTTNSNLLLAELKRVYGVKNISGGRQRAAVDKKSDELLASALKLDHLDQEYAEIASQKLAKQVELIQHAQGEVKSAQTKTVLTDIAKNTEELRKRFEQNSKNSTVNPVPDPATDR